MDCVCRFWSFHDLSWREKREKKNRITPAFSFKLQGGKEGSEGWVQEGRRKQKHPMTREWSKRSWPDSGGETNQKRRDFLRLPVLQCDAIHLLQLISFMDQAFQVLEIDTDIFTTRYSLQHVHIACIIIMLPNCFNDYVGLAAHHFYQQPLLSWSSPQQ